MRYWQITIGLVALVAGGVIILDSCSKPSEKHNIPIAFTVPQGFPQTVHNFQTNPVTQEGFVLGRKLFYDTRLSLDNSVSCESCHQVVASFTTFQHDRSHGYNHSHTLRNAPALLNLAWYPVFNQDGSARSLEEVYIRHITSTTDMSEVFPHVIDKIKHDPEYQRLFNAAYGKNEISAYAICDALSQFVLSLTANNAKYDQVARGEAAFTADEQSGYLVFKDKCANCHKEPLFTDFSFRNTGLEVDNSLKDFGRMRVTGKSEDSLKFRVPALRNLEITAYYGHDGRMSLPRHMIQHYRTGVIPGATVDPLVANGITLTNAQETQLVAFLRTLTDSTVLKDPRYRE